MHPEMEVIPPARWPEREPLLGPEAAWAFYREFDEVIESDRPYEVTELVASGDKVLFCQEAPKHGHESAAEVEFKLWGVVTFDDEGRATRAEWFTEREPAVKAAGAP